jgi:dimethylaniline monooxygenase (N-oxide forming)
LKVRPGAIPPLSELQAQFWVLRLLQQAYPQQCPRPAPGKTLDANAVAPYDLDFELHARGGYDMFANKGGVDHESYAYQLAVDMGAAPTLTFMLEKPFRVLYTWAMGPNFNTKFRLIGPWKWEGAEEVMANELFNVVKRTGGIVCE